MLPHTLSIAGPDGETRALMKAGARVPGTAKAVFATQRAGERKLVCRVFEGEPGEAPPPALVATFSAELPSGLPANCWLTVTIEVGEDNVVRARVRENLRRIDVAAEADVTGATAQALRA